MEIEAMKKLLKNTDIRRRKFIDRYQISQRYYQNENDITRRNNGKSIVKEDGNNDKKGPLRSADNRVSSNFHQLLVDQEAGYLATKPPTIDVNDATINQKIINTLGDNFGLRLNELVIDSANAGNGWLHYWLDADQQFRYGIVPPDQITPIYSSDLNRKLIALRRTYDELNPDTGKQYSVHEYWTDKEVTVFKSEQSDYSDLEPFNNRFSIYDVSTGVETGQSNVYSHNFERIPFICFPKNKYQIPDLLKYKGLIDVYDKVYNGFVNDIDDVQQVILILTNYGGEDFAEFMKNLKNFKAIKIDSTGTGDRSGVDKLTIDIPVEARNSLLDITKSNIFVHGQGIDPTDFETNNATGEAIKMLYSHLELKAAKTEAYFRDAITELIRAIMKWLNITDANSRQITQKWTRTAIQNDLEQAQIVTQLANYSSKEAVAKANPIVEDWQQELKDQQSDQLKRVDDFANGKELDKLDENE